MKCPNCGHEEHRVCWTRDADDRIKRGRDCLQCGKRFHTAEVLTEVFDRTREIEDAFRAMQRAVGE